MSEGVKKLEQVLTWLAGRIVLLLFSRVAARYGPLYTALLIKESDDAATY